MSVRSRIFRRTPPWLLRAACIMRLAKVTQEAFGCRPRKVSGLDSFASLTVRQAEAALHAGGETSKIEEKLSRGALHLGRRIRFWLGIHGRGESLAVARALYRILEIDFRANADGRFTVPRCRFSSCYSPAVCRLISSLDCGLLAGLTGGARMVFTRRITEGAAACAGEIG
jgi:hypothetical protein